MRQELRGWEAAVDASFAGHDYPEGRVVPPDPESIYWFDAPQYAPYLESWLKRWEYQSYVRRVRSSPNTNRSRSATRPTPLAP
jgi:hypothetical protein